MDDLSIRCPKCKTEIKLTESLAAPLLETARLDFERREKEVREELLKNQLEEKEAATRDATKKALARFDGEIKEKTKALADLAAELHHKDEKLAEAQRAQAEFLRKQREVEDAKRELDLTVEKRVQAEASALRDRSRREVEEEMRLKVSEKEQTILSMQKKIEELRLKAEQGSQQLQGEVQEIELENTLRSKFPVDGIDAVPKGEHGGDVLQYVSGPFGKPCGRILWESKRTKSWSDGWLPKLREDQRAAKAEFSVIVSQVLPKDVETFDFVDGVWVVSPKAAIPMAVALRQTLIELSLARQAVEGKESKASFIYEYVVGPRFKQRVQAIVEAFTSMKEDLDKEKRSTTKNWARREEQISRVVESTASMYGELEGIAGSPLAEIKELEGEV
jgi:hypothetical protein